MLNPAKYRPVKLNPGVSRIMVMLVKQKLVACLPTSLIAKIVGFLKIRSCAAAILPDMTKTFDRIVHNSLLPKANFKSWQIIFTTGQLVS